MAWSYFSIPTRGRHGTKGAEEERETESEGSEEGKLLGSEPHRRNHWLCVL